MYAAYNRAYRPTRGDRRDRRVKTLQATGRRDDRSDSRGDDRPVYTAYNNTASARFAVLQIGSATYRMR